MAYTSNTIPATFLRIATGDKTAYAELYREYAEQIYAVALYYARNKELAEDTVQFVFLKVWERREDLAGMDNPMGWIYNTARFHIINTFKKQVAEQQLYEAMLPQADPTDPGFALINKQRSAIILQAIDALPERQQQIYRMSREEGLTYAEIAEQLKLGKETVKEHMVRALKKLRETLEKQRDALLLLLWWLLKNIFY